MFLKDLINILDELVDRGLGDLDLYGWGGLQSWRGNYSQLTLVDNKYPLTVESALIEAVEANGKTFPGYKGGQYHMSGYSNVWGDDSGMSDCIRLLGIGFIPITDDNKVILSVIRSEM